MKLTEEELIDTWRYFQYCCLPSIIMAKYAYMDYIDDIRNDRNFYRHRRKQAINRIGADLVVLPGRLMDVSRQNVRYMNILGDNIEEQFEQEEEELHQAVFISLRNARMQHLECLTALHYISAFLQMAAFTFRQCCHDLQLTTGRDMSKVFDVYDIQNLVDRWHKVTDEAAAFYGYDKTDRKSPSVDLNNPRCIKDIKAIMEKLNDIETLRTAMRKSYPWSPNFKGDIPYEQSVDYRIVHYNDNQQEDQQIGYPKAGQSHPLQSLCKVCGEFRN